MIANAISNLNPVEIQVNKYWSKFLLHNVPTHADLNIIYTKIEATYPSLCLGQTPCWLVPAEKCVNKAASTLIVTFIGAIDYKNLGTTSIAVCNWLCRIEEYFTWSPVSQCKNCQQYGHHPCLCKAPKPTYAISVQPHTIKDHPYAISTCYAGAACTYPLLKCAAYGNPHKGNDPNCPTQLKHMMDLRNKMMVLQDMTME
jgi:hypothetical protein